MVRVERADAERFNRSRIEWNRLVDVMRRPSPFCTWEWIHTWWMHFGGRYELVLLFFYRGDALIGILPLASGLTVIENGVIPGRVLSYCGSTELASDHVDVICAPDEAVACLDAAMGFLRRDYRGWDVIHWSHVAEDAAMIEWIRRGKPAPLDADARVVSTAAYVPLDEGFAGFRRTLSQKRRHELNRLRRVLHDQLGAAYVPSRVGEIPKEIREVFDLQNRRAASKGIRSAFAGEKLMRFHVDFATLASEAGRLRLRFLRKDESAIAAWYCFDSHGRVFCYQHGFDPEWEKRSVARVLLYELIDEACGDGFKELDLLRGGHEYKSQWTPHRRLLMNVNIYSDTPTGRLIRWTCRGRHALAAALSRLKARVP